MKPYFNKPEDLAGRSFPDGEITNEEYHAMPGMSCSGLKLIGQSPQHFRHAMDNPPEPSKSMILGNMLHMAVLQPKAFGSTYAPIDDKGLNKNTKAYKQLFENWALDNNGLIPVFKKDWDMISGIVAALANHSIAESLIQGGHAESSMWWEDVDTGILCKCRPDYIVTIIDGPWLIDLKTISDMGRIENQIYDYGYYIQDPFYCDGYQAVFGEKPKFVFIFVESTPPHGVKVVALNADSKEWGRKVYKRNLETFKNCKTADMWPTYSNRVEEVSLPSYAYYRLEQEG